MTSTLTRSRFSEQPSTDALRFRGIGPRRRPVVAIASLALIASCVAIFTSVYLHAGNRVAVLAVVRNVPLGREITSSDLGVVQLSLSAALSPVPAKDISHVVGRVAAVSLVRGTLISPSELAVRGAVAQGEAVVGVATKVGQLPAAGVTDGDTVNVILTGSPIALANGTASAPPNASATGDQVEVGGVLASNVTVTGVAIPSSSPDTIVVSVLIPSSLAPIVANASAAGQAALVLVGPNS